MNSAFIVAAMFYTDMIVCVCTNVTILAPFLILHHGELQYWGLIDHHIFTNS